jgi:hypothetical protein
VGAQSRLDLIWIVAGRGSLDLPVAVGKSSFAV